MSKTSESYSSDKSEDISDCEIDWSFTVFNSRYICIKKLGQGAYCSVWLSYDFDSSKFYALKITSREDYGHMKKELKIFEQTSKFKTEHMSFPITTFEYESKDYQDNENSSDSDSNIKMKSNTFICIVHELYGYSLYDVLTMYKNEKMTIPVDFILEVIKQSCNTLNIIHKNGYVHSDIKPENILVRKPKLYFIKLKSIIENLKIKHRYSKKQINKFIEDMKKHLIDYIDDDHKEDPAEVYKYLFQSSKLEFVICDMGSLMRKQSEDIFRRHTIYYRSPEVLLYNQDQFDEKYDAWSLGCSIYEILMGKVLFDPDDGDITRNHLFLISECFGMLPKHMILKSKKKHLFFSKNMERIRGYAKIEFKPIFVFLLEKIMGSPPNPNYDKHLKLINIVKDFLDCDVTTRLSPNQVLTTYFK